MRKVMFLFVGTISLVLGVIGIVIPILPTVPFLLLTSLCYVRGSTQFHEWFISTSIYKKHLEPFITYKTMDIRKELFLLIWVSAVLCIAMWKVNNLMMSIVLTILIICKYYYFIMCVRSVGGTYD